jgi:hypothetical protein
VLVAAGWPFVHYHHRRSASAASDSTGVTASNNIANNLEPRFCILKVRCAMLME